MENMDMKTLGEKCVINLCNGKELGYVCDLEFSIESGQICAIVVPKDKGLLSFGCSERYVIPWCKIECIGEDVILVKADRDDCYYDPGKKKGEGRKGVFGF